MEGMLGITATDPYLQFLCTEPPGLSPALSSAFYSLLSQPQLSQALLRVAASSGGGDEMFRLSMAIDVKHFRV